MEKIMIKTTNEELGSYSMAETQLMKEETQDT